MVSQWLKAETIKADEKGYIDWQEAERSIAATRDPSKPLQRSGTPHEDSIFSDENTVYNPEDVNRRYNAARMLKMEEDARLSSIKRQEAEGELISRDEVKDAARVIGVRVRAKMMAIPARVSGELVAMTDPKKIGQFISDEIREALTALAGEFDE